MFIILGQGYGKSVSCFNHRSFIRERYGKSLYIKGYRRKCKNSKVKDMVKNVSCFEFWKVKDMAKVFHV
ncbi:hypothetical protein E0M35_30050 [Bacillus thuringiensis]|nr:hypothetical protein EEL55_19850 [Bacillus thuringiensis]RUR60083.1 hypothetical protein ELS81_28365 [Bacillus sp. VKPM B-3276]TBX38242.1 hypothetical protein E0M35_30050 [Bacillus thuringiensis]